jgi:hypothetical protein
MMRKNIKNNFIFFIFFAFFSCNSNQDLEIAGLKDGETKAEIKVKGKDFYQKESVFKGEVMVFPTLIRINITDQFNDNIIIALNDPSLHKTHPISKSITVDNMANVSVLFGKLYKESKEKGIGYIVGEGKIEVIAMNDNIMKIKINGKAGNYLTLSDSTTWEPMAGVLTIKKPKFNFTNVKKEDVYF